jgi:hypothetical protein|tara:strand:+ start:82 stop:336 length:255 start_codon:yes stop_codon:yes gene_type:complete
MGFFNLLKMGGKLALKTPAGKKAAKSVFNKIKMKDAKKIILEPAKKATKKKVKKNLQPVKDLGKGTATGTVVSSEVNSRKNKKK